MNILSNAGVDRLFHIAPLHYIPFIARSQRLKPKAALRNEGFSETHFRSKSKHLDDKRGFGDYLHLSTVSHPPILEAKLGGGFPHVCISLPVSSLNGMAYDLCRYNVAMTRKLRRNGKLGFQEAPKNGRYYGDMQIPIARKELERRQLIEGNQGEMLEVLCKQPIHLNHETIITAFSNEDRQIVQNTLNELEIKWGTLVSNKPNYIASPKYFEACSSFVKAALEDSDWKGNGLEFDRV